MPYRLCAQCLLVFLFCISASACALRPVRVIQEPQFNAMCRRLKTEMTRRSLLDAEGNYLAGLLPSPALRGDYGRILFERLSPSFRYGGQAPATAPKTFLESAASMKEVRIREYGFSMKQGLDTVDVDMLALADWEGGGGGDWLISCRVLSGGAPLSRTYYAAIAEPADEGILTARAVALYECGIFDCTLYTDGSYLPETPVLEFLPGQRPVTTPPAAAVKQSRKPR